MTDLYRNVAPEVSTGFSFDDEVLKKALKRIYNEDFNPMTEIEENLFNEFWDKLNEATYKGIGNSGVFIDPDDDFHNALRYNNGVFSAFKVHRMQNDMAARLLDENGVLKPFEQWLNDVQDIADHQNRIWFKTEYDTAIKRAHQAAEWKQFEREADILPNLEWIKTTAINPGLDHKVFWFPTGIIRPINDSLWNEHKPGDRWGCKCSLRATDKPVTPLRGSSTLDNPAPGLDNNPGEEGILFSDSHPYNPPNCAACTLPGEKVLSNNSAGKFFNAAKGKKDCYHCSRPMELMKKAGVATKESKKSAEEISKKLDKLYEKLVSERKIAQESHIKQKRLHFDNLKTGNITTSKKTMKAILNHIYNNEQLKAALVINRNISSLKFIRVSPLGEGKDMTNPVDIANVQAKVAKGITNYNSYEYRYKGNVFYVKTEEVNIRGHIFERIYSFTRKP